MTPGLPWTKGEQKGLSTNVICFPESLQWLQGGAKPGCGGASEDALCPLRAPALPPAVGPKPQVAWIEPDLLFLPQDLTGGAFEDNLRSLRLQEGQDFLHFS